MILEEDMPDFSKLSETCLRESIYGATNGLQDDVFSLVASLTPMVNVDLLIRDEFGKVLLSWRDDGKNYGWHIPGGIVRFKERFEDRLQLTAMNEIGFKVEFDAKPLSVNEIIMPYQRRGHFISFLYNCRLPKGCVVTNSVKENESGFLKWFSDMPHPLVDGQNCYYDYLSDIFKSINMEVENEVI